MARAIKDMFLWAENRGTPMEDGEIVELTCVGWWSGMYRVSLAEEDGRSGYYLKRVNDRSPQEDE